jgi:hypothetical protein
MIDGKVNVLSQIHERIVRHEQLAAAYKRIAEREQQTFDRIISLSVPMQNA